MTAVLRTTRERRAIARAASSRFDGVISRRALAALGVDARMVRREVAADRWQVRGRQTIATHLSALTARARRWRAIWEVGEAVAALDGVTALQEAGLTGYDEESVHVSVLHRHDVVPVSGVVIHKVIRRQASEIVPSGIPRVRAEIASIRAAHWARSDRQAALVL